MKKILSGMAVVGAVTAGVWGASQKHADPWQQSLAEARKKARPAANCAKPAPEHRAACARLFPDAGTP